MDRKRSRDDTQQSETETDLMAALLLSMGVTSPLRQHQLDGVSDLLGKLYKEHCALLCFDMGLGKTLTALATWIMFNAKDSPYGPYDGAGAGTPLLVVAGKSEIQVWQTQCSDHLEKRNVLFYEGSGRAEKLTTFVASEDPFAVFVTYETLAREAAASPMMNFKWQLVIFDEIQKVKNMETVSKSKDLAVT